MYPEITVNGDRVEFDEASADPDSICWTTINGVVVGAGQRGFVSVANRGSETASVVIRYEGFPEMIMTVKPDGKPMFREGC